MRKLRDILFYAFLIIPAVGIVIGVQYATKNKHSGKTPIAAIQSDRDPRDDDASEAVEHDKVATNSHVDRKIARAEKGSHNREQTVARMEKSTGEYATRSTAAEHASLPVDSHGTNLTDDSKTAKISDNVCRSVEYVGDSPEHIVVAKNEWTVVMDSFHDIKDDYLKWLKEHKDGFSKEQFTVLESRVKFTRIQRPPSADEPDMAWRGFAAWSLDGANEPLIKIGGGFMQLAQKDPKRAKFELARMVAQGWAPCELKRLAVGEMWNGLTSCLKVENTDACVSGSYSEAAWAVGSALAVQIAAPGCTVPAFTTPEINQCLQSIVPFKTTASASNRDRKWKEARR